MYIRLLLVSMLSVLSFGLSSGALAGHANTDNAVPVWPDEESTFLMAIHGCDKSKQGSSIERFNRSMFAFNNFADKYAVKPIAQAYNFIMPDFMVDGIGNMFSNLAEPNTMVNSLLQGKPKNMCVSFARFVTNSTIGVGGFFDVASYFGLNGHKEDFGQTLAKWGMPQGSYLVLPFLGSSTVRDAIGLAPDIFANPVRYMQEPRDRNSISGVGLINSRAQLLDKEKLIIGDRYEFLKDLYLGTRNSEIMDGALSDVPTDDDFVE